jgi:hypothetical protein
MKRLVWLVGVAVLAGGGASRGWAQTGGDSGSGACVGGVCQVQGTHNGGGGGSQGAGNGGGGVHSGGGHGGSGSGCADRYVLVPDQMMIAMEREQRDYIDSITQPKGVVGDYYYVYDCQGNPTGQVVFIPTGSSGPAGTIAPVDPAALAAQALKQITFPTPVIHMNPDVTQDQLTGLRTWMWVDPDGLGTKSATATAGPVVVTGTLSATKVVWDMGNGDKVTCNGPGTPYDPARPDADPTCSYTYRQSSAGRSNNSFPVTATITWQGSYTVAGAPGGGNLGPVGRTSTVNVRVAENQSINNG